LPAITLHDTSAVLWGQGSFGTRESEVKDAVTAFLADLGSPFEAPSDSPGLLEAKKAAVGEWLRSMAVVRATA